MGPMYGKSDLICVVSSQGVFESEKWELRKALERDNERHIHIVISKYPDGAPKVLVKGKISKRDQVIIVFTDTNDVNVCDAIITDVLKKAGSVTCALYTNDKHMCQDKIERTKRVENYKLMAQSSGSNTSSEDESDCKPPYEQEILMGPHTVQRLSSKVYGYFLVPHSEIAITSNSSAFNMNTYFMKMVMDDLMKTYENWKDYSFVVLFPDYGAKHRFAEQIEVVGETLSVPLRMITCDKERNGLETKTSLTLNENQRSDMAKKSIVICYDDVIRSGRTTMDAINKVKEYGHPDNIYVAVSYHLSIVNEDGYTINKDIENRLVGHLNDGSLHKIYTTDSIPAVTCKVNPAITVMNVTAEAIKYLKKTDNM